ncbi:hypothetical protein [Arsenophonus nasoniae]|uniref:Uncharacterized protein n=1 Tax=Arsenophonus nasoniae TaxID=638 RepID=A0AA95K944_9GAMM|nr:hypothetical protein [Arsenophonus nasoniae]WGL96512.1 hypothetical protein QE207_08220 [Arsenophonus nasoniae]
MKLLEKCERETKQVNYFGIELTIDADINFLATDDDGFVYGYCKKPMKVPERWKPKFTLQQPIAKVDLGDKDWKETLVEV